MKKKKRHIPRKIIIAALAVAGVALAGTIAKPDTVNIDVKPQPEQIAEAIDLPPQIDAPIDLGVQEEDEDEEKKLSFFAGLRKKYLSIAPAVRSIFAVPVYALSWLAKIALSSVLGLSGHLLSSIMGPLLAALALLAAVVIGLKVIFPDMPLKELLSKASYIAIYIAAFFLDLAAIKAIDYWSAPQHLKEIIPALLLLVFAGSIFFYVIEKQKAKAALKNANA